MQNWISKTPIDRIILRVFRDKIVTTNVDLRILNLDVSRFEFGFFHDFDPCTIIVKTLAVHT